MKPPSSAPAAPPAKKTVSEKEPVQEKPDPERAVREARERDLVEATSRIASLERKGSGSGPAVPAKGADARIQELKEAHARELGEKEKELEDLRAGRIKALEKGVKEKGASAKGGKKKGAKKVAKKPDEASRLKEERKLLKKGLLEKDQAIAQLKKSHAGELKEKEKSVSALREAAASLLADDARALREQKKTAEELKASLAKAASAWEAEPSVDDLKKAHSQALSELKASHARALEEKENELGGLMAAEAQATEAKETARRELAEERARKETEAGKATDELKEAHARALSELKASHAKVLEEKESELGGLMASEAQATEAKETASRELAEERARKETEAEKGSDALKEAHARALREKDKAIAVMKKEMDAMAQSQAAAAEELSGAEDEAKGKREKELEDLREVHAKDVQGKDAEIDRLKGELDAARTREEGANARLGELEEGREAIIRRISDACALDGDVDNEMEGAVNSLFDLKTRFNSQTPPVEAPELDAAMESLIKTLDLLKELGDKLKGSEVETGTPESGAASPATTPQE